MKKNNKRKKEEDQEKESKPQPLKTFEEQYVFIDKEIKKRRGKWFLDSLAWFDFEDVEQISRFHIFKKWDQWDQKRPLEPWVNRIISNQLKHILRNNYMKF